MQGQGLPPPLGDRKGRHLRLASPDELPNTVSTA
jgi:hypothetical protein